MASKNSTIKRIDMEMDELIKEFSQKNKISERIASREIAKTFRKLKNKTWELKF